MVQAERGPGSAAEAEALAGLARIHRRRREFDKAYDVVSRAIEISIERRGPSARPLLFHYYFRASVALALRRLQQAQNDIERFVTVLNQIEAGGDGVPSAVHPMRPAVDVLRGRVLAARGDNQGALAAYRQAVGNFDRLHDGAPHLDTATALSNVGSMLLSLDRLEDARASLERGLKILGEAQGRNPSADGAIRFGLAAALVELDPSQRDRALRLACDAKTSYALLGAAPMLKQVDAWLAEQGASAAVCGA